MVGFKTKARASAYFTKLGWRRGCVLWVGCVWGDEYMCIWLGCVRRVGMYWKEREKRNYTIISYLLH